jgi:hypothetical protein
MKMNRRTNPQLFIFLIVVAVVLRLPLAGAQDASNRPALAKLSDSSFWTFEKFRGEGTMRVIQSGRGDVIELSSDSIEGMAASVRSRPFPVEPNRQYTITMDVKTEGLEAIDASLTGGAYMQFWDAQHMPGSYQPSDAVSTPAPENSEWHIVSQKVTVPSTAKTAELRLVFAAFGPYTDTLRPRDSGRAKGRVWIRSVQVEASDRVTPLPATVHVSDPKIQAAIDVVAECMHNASLNGIFVDSDGYTDSSNIVPDLSFGLYGVRRQGQSKYLDILRKQWEDLGASATADGKLPQRVMSQILFPIGVDEIFSFTGDGAFLAKMLPIADRTLGFVNKRADSNGFVRLVDHGKWVIGEGADWVDWYPTRMEGKTFNFHQWYVRALRRMAALHEEFAGTPDGQSFASAERAREYRKRADQVEQSLRQLYWADDHFVTNIDYDGKVADQKWMDDQVWAIRFGVATPEQTRKIWAWADRRPQELEGMPTAWAAFSGPEHGPSTWFGRTGAGDILARYRSGNPARGLALLERISEVFARDHNVYEAYTMDGTVVPGTLGWGNYTEHCGGFIMALIGGPFGLDLDSDHDAVATLAPQFPKEWTYAQADVYIRGARVKIQYARTGGKATLSLSGEAGTEQPIRVVLPQGGTQLVRIGAGVKRSFDFSQP